MGILRDMLHIIKDVDVDISEREPRKGTETMESSRRMSCQRWKFQNVNPERGRNRL